MTEPSRDSSEPRAGVSRRGLLGVTAVGGLAFGVAQVWPGADPVGRAIGPDSPLVAAAERRRTTTGRTVTQRLVAQTGPIDLGGRVVETSTFAGRLPGREIRATSGDRLQLTVSNQLEVPTSVHWHGLALRNDMDGVPGLTQPAIAPNAEFTYDFVAPHPGTYWFHPHSGVQLDRGLYAPLIIEDPAEAGDYDDESVLVIDDWTDGWTDTPDEVLARFKAEGMPSMAGMGDMDMPTGVSETTPLGTDTGDVSYPGHLINGRLPGAPHVVRGGAGQRLRLRLINAGADTAYRVAVGGHQMTVTHTDGFPVRPTTVDALILGMGERYDVLIDAQEGTFPIAARPEGKDGPAALALLTSSPGSPDSVTEAQPAELDGRLLTYQDLEATEAATLTQVSPDRELTMTLEMGDEGRRWLIGNRTYDDVDPFEVQAGERVRLEFRNDSTMFHPMHVHGHTFSVGTSGRGPRKDTVNVLPKSTLTVDLDTDNPGQWLTHCHNVYHGELGMMTVVSYVEQ